jgi:hypothetical protein
MDCGAYVGVFFGMSLLPYMISTIAGAIGWAVGRKIEGIFTASMLALLGSILGFYYGRKWVNDLKEMMGR